jgi:hypothetical protein
MPELRREPGMFIGLDLIPVSKPGFFVSAKD